MQKKTKLKGTLLFSIGFKETLLKKRSKKKCLRFVLAKWKLTNLICGIDRCFVDLIEFEYVCCKKRRLTNCTQKTAQLILI